MTEQEGPAAEKRFRLSWEYQNENGEWIGVERVNGGDILDQHSALAEWAETGEEPIRNVELKEVDERRWGICVCPDCGERSEVGWCCKGCRSEPWDGSKGGSDGKMATRCEFIEVVPAPDYEPASEDS